MLHLPTWLTELWLTYKDVVMPILVTLISALVTVISLKLKTDAKLNSAKADLQIEAMQKIADKEDTKPELKEQAIAISENRQAIVLLAQMFGLAFANSTLDDETKVALKTLENKIMYGTEEDLVAELQNQVNRLTEQLEEAKKEIPVVVDGEQSLETVTRIRR